MGIYCIPNENYTFGAGVRNYLRAVRKGLRTPTGNYLRAVRKGLRTPTGHHQCVSLE